MKRVLLIFILTLSVCGITAQNVDVDFTAKVYDKKMEWWKEAKFGMFVHWGVYTPSGGLWGDTNTYAEWMMYTAKIPRAEYEKLAARFNPVKFNAEEWVLLAKSAGQKYIVFTTKHHDGFAMFKSKASDYNIVDKTPFARDVVKELVEACRKHDMKLGFYYSQAQDWWHPGGGRSRNEPAWDPAQEGDMDEYIDKVALPQVVELLENYGDVAVFWWDTPVNMSEERAKKFKAIVDKYPNMITNNRLGRGVGGDLDTPEQYIPATGFPNRNWEVCMTMNGRWGYNAYDDNWKSTTELVRKLVDVVSKGGNLLLNVGPDALGVIPPVCQNNLREIGQWLELNGEAVYGTQASPFAFLPWGRATRKGDKLYLHLFEWNHNITFEMTAKMKRAYLLADPNSNLKFTQKNGYATIELPAYSPDKAVSVIAVEYDGEIQTQTVPSVGAKVYDIVGSDPMAEDIVNLNDGLPRSRWQTTSQNISFIMELSQPTHIQGYSFMENWDPWDHVSQNYKLEAMVNNRWVKLSEGVSDGVGMTIVLEPIKAQKFRFSFNNLSNKNVGLKEVTLYR